MSSYPWFRYYSETKNDRKLDLIAEESGMHILMVQGAWAVLLCLANDSPIRGALYVTTLKRYSNIYIAKQLQLSLEDTEKLLKLFAEYSMIEFDINKAIQIKNWDNRQFKSDSSVDRVRRFREAKKKEEEDGNNDETLHETLPSASVSASVSVSLSFDEVKDILRVVTGYPMTGKASVEAIKELVAMKATKTDIESGAKWCIENGKRLVYYKTLVGPTKTAIAIRMQNDNLKPKKHEPKLQQITLSDGTITEVMV